MRSRYAQPSSMEGGSGSLGGQSVMNDSPMAAPPPLETELNQAQINLNRAEDVLNALIQSFEMSPGADVPQEASFAGILGAARNINNKSERLCDGINYLASLIVAPKPQTMPSPPMHRG